MQWSRLSPILKSKVNEIMGVAKSFFFYKVADRIGTELIEDNYGNDLVVMGIILASLFMVLVVWDQVGEIMYDEIEAYHATHDHDENETSLIAGGEDSEATLIGFMFPLIVLFQDFLMLVVLWQGQMLSVVIGSYFTQFSQHYTSFSAIPITLAIGFFMLLATNVINPPPKRKRE